MYSSATTPEALDRIEPPRTERSPYSVMLRAFGTLLTIPPVPVSPTFATNADDRQEQTLLAK